MTTIDILAGFILFLLAVIALIVHTVQLSKKPPKTSLREIGVFPRLQRAIGFSVEEGSRVHVSIGRSSLTNPTNASALVGLTTLEHITRQSINSDRPPISTSGDGALSILSQDVQCAGTRKAGAPELYDHSRAWMTGPTPFSYLAGLMPVVGEKNTRTHLLIGNYGPEMTIAASTAQDNGAYVLAASDSLPTQAALYAAVDDVLIGEELFAAPAYLEMGAAYRASLAVQDLLRWVLIALLLAGAVLNLTGLL